MLKFLARCSVGLDRLATLTGAVVGVLLSGMVLLAGYNALARWGGRFVGLNLSSNSLLETQWYLFSLVFLGGAAFTLKNDAHVRIDVVYGRLGVRERAWIDLLGTLWLLIPFCVFGMVVTLPGVLQSWAIAEQSPDPGGLPRYPLKAVVPLAFLLLLLQGLSELGKRVLVLQGRLDLLPEKARQALTGAVSRGIEAPPPKVTGSLGGGR